ncbi:MAG: hypothetical protein IPH84_10620 [Bacteroidales bacterium]|nr:hypothetical protein [Bacteroidales bacterium]
MENPFEEIMRQLNRIEGNQIELMKKIGSAALITPAPKIMTVAGLIQYLEEKTGKKYSVATVYSWTNKQLIPFRKANNKSLVFEKVVIDQWLLDDKSLSDEVQKKACDEVMLKANARRIYKLGSSDHKPKPIKTVGQ